MTMPFENTSAIKAHQSAGIVYLYPQPAPEGDEQTTTIVLTDIANESTPSRWHDHHTQVYKVAEGKVSFSIGTTTKVLGPEEGEVKIPPGTIYSFRREDFGGIDVNVVEKPKARITVWCRSEPREFLTSTCILKVC